MKPLTGWSVGLGLVLAITVACSGGAERDDAGRIVGEGDLGVFDFNVGDCFQDPQGIEAAGGTGVANVAAVPCDTPHDNEVYSLFDLSGRFEAWPGTSGVEAVAAEVCLDAFQPYVGRDYETSRLAFTSLNPTEETWEERDDREVVCVLFDVDLAKLTGSKRNSGE